MTKKILNISFRRISLPAIFLFMLGGCASLGRIIGYHDPVASLREKIDAVLADSLFTPTRASIKVVSLDRKEVLYEREGKMLMRPASNLKLLTSSTALAVLGNNFSFRTIVSADSPVVDGILKGNLYLKGFGNPDLKTSDLDSLVVQVQAKGIKEVEGGIVADVSYFDDFSWGNGWMWDDEPDPDEMFISPLSLNDNCVTVSVAHGAKDGDSVVVQINPSTAYVSLINNATTTKDSVLRPLRATRLFKERLNTIVVDGQVPLGTQPHEQQISVWRPELYAAQVFKEELNKRAIIVDGNALVRPDSTTGTVVATHSRTLDSVVVNLNKTSDNLSAENTLKTISAYRWGPPGKSATGIYVVNEFLSSLGIDTTKYNMVDGSGVSHYNLLTADMLVQLLQGMARQNDLFPLFYQSLPIAGVDGTLRNRMKGTRAEGNLRAKTGSLSGVSSLSGYVKTLDDEMLVFSVLMQSFIGSSRGYRIAQDSIGVLLANFSRRQSTTIIAP